MLVVAGSVVATIPVQTIIGIGCEEGSCAAYARVSVPSIFLGSAIVVAGIVLFGYGAIAEESADG